MSTEEEKGIIRKIEKGIERAVDEYVQNPGVSIAVASIPIIGPVLDTIIQTTGREIAQKRFLDLCYALKSEIAYIDDTKIDKAFLESEEGYDLILRMFKAAVETAEREKIQLYARILIRAAILDNAHFRYSAKDFLSILLELSPTDLRIAREIYKQQKDTADKVRHTENELSVVKKSGWESLPTMCEVDNFEFDLSLTKLTRAGLIREVVGAYMDYQGGVYRITPTFRRLMTLVQKLD